MAYLHLGLALEASGERSSALRAYRAARNAVDRSDRPEIEQALGGYGLEELIRLLDIKQSDILR
jgi:hypothetical protein